MTPKVITKINLLMVTVLSILCLCCVLVVAQENAAVSQQYDSTPDVTPSDVSDAAWVYDIGSFTLPDGTTTRKKEYYAKIFKAENKPWIIFHEPILLFDPVQPGKEIQGYPNTVQSAEMNDDGSATLTFHIRMSTPHIRTQIMETFKREASSIIEGWKLKNDGISNEIVPKLWPVKAAFIICRLPNNTVLSHFPIMNLQNSTEGVATLVLNFSPDELAMFKEAAAKDEVEFLGIYSFTGRFIETSTVSLVGSLDINSELVNDLNSNLTSDQIQGKEYVFQEYANSASNSISQKINVDIYARNPGVVDSLLARVKTNEIMSKVFDLHTKALSDLTPAEEATLELYLTPQIQAWANQKSTNESETSQTDTTDSSSVTKSVVDTREKIKTESIGANVGASVGPFSAGGSYNLTKTDKESNQKSDVEQTVQSLNTSLGKSIGVTFGQSANGTGIIPKEIRLFKRNSAVTKLEFKEFDTITVGRDAKTATLSISPVPLSLTVDRVDTQTSAKAYLPGVVTTTPGMMFPWVGTDEAVPWGWVIPDDRESTNGLPNVFPVANWVPKDWRGKRIPDLTGYFMATTKDLEEVLSIHNAADYDHTHNAAVPEHKIAVKPVEKVEGSVVVGAERVTSENIARILEASIGKGLREDAANYLKNKMSFRSAVLNTFCGWNGEEYWANPLYWNNYYNKPFAMKEYSWYRSEYASKNNYPEIPTRKSVIKNNEGRLVETVEKILQLSTRNGLKSDGHTTTGPYTYAEVINDPVKILEVMSYHWMLQEPWAAHNYFPKNTNVLPATTKITVPAIDIKAKDAPFELNPDAPENMPSHFKARLILRIL